MTRSPETRVALLGASGQIARSLISQFVLKPPYRLYLLDRRPQGVKLFVKALAPHFNGVVLHLNRFEKHAYDVVINCVGITDPAKLIKNRSQIFAVTELFENRIIKYLLRNPQTLYLHLSSGSVYGPDYSHPVNAHTVTMLDLHALRPSQFNGIAKLHAEAKHRAHPQLRIVDLRLFNYFDRFADLNSAFFVNTIAAHLLARKPLTVSADDSTRDYVHPVDFSRLIQLCIQKKAGNDFVDVYSRKPVKKFELLNHLKKTFGLNFRIEKGHSRTVASTGQKSFYFSKDRKAQTWLGYKPRYSALETITMEIGALLNAQQQSRS